MATRNGLDQWAQSHQYDLRIQEDIHDRPTDPGPFDPSSEIRPIVWNRGYALTRFHTWARVRNWVAIQLARLSGWLAP